MRRSHKYKKKKEKKEKKDSRCPKSPLTTLNLNDLKIKSCIGKPNTCTIFLALNVMIELVLLKIYKLNKFKGLDPQNLMFAYLHVLTDGIILHH